MVSKPLLSKRNTIVKGYAAFNDADWDTLRELLCQDVVWHPMDHHAPDIEGRDAVLAELQRLRTTNEAEFLGAAIHDDTAIALDFTHSLDDEGDHACGDRIRFDEASGCIIEVWHCVTHPHNDAGNPASG
jgi:ketosteroid isomerase-like protein